MADLRHRPDQQTKENLLQALFWHDLVAKNAHHLQSYLEYYEKEIGKLSVGRFSQTQSGLIAKSHPQLVGLIAKLRIDPADQWSDVCSVLSSQHAGADETSVNKSLDLVVRLWLMLNIRDPETRLHANQTPLVSWVPRVSFSGFVDTTFPRSRWVIEAREGRLHPSFTASFMTEICGLKPEWTSCLADHLRLDHRRKVLRVFAYKAFIAGHLDTHEASSSMRQSPLPEQLLVETLWTINLLFPHWDPGAIALLRDHGQKFQCVGPYDGPPTLNLIEFEYWRDGIAELYDVVFSSPPVSRAQLWRDRRSPRQFWTFWIALVILALTLISTAATIVQTWASVTALRQ